MLLHELLQQCQEILHIQYEKIERYTQTSQLIFLTDTKTQNIAI